MVLVFVLAELGTRLLVGPVQPRNLTLVPKSIRAATSVPGVPYLLAANAEVTQPFGSDPRGYFDAGATLTYRTNSLGWRSPEARPEKPPGVFRILGIGDSVTFGTGVRAEHVFLSRLRDALEAEAPGRYEVWNLGVMGYNTAHEVALLQHVGVGLEPDLVLLCYLLNDAEALVPRSFLESLALDAPSARGPREQRSPSLLVDHLRRRLENREVRRRTIERTLASYRQDSPGWAQARGALRQAALLARRHGFALALVIFPNLWQLDVDYPFAEAHAKVAAVARRLDLAALDLLDPFRGRDAEALWVHPANQHPNEEAHAIAAEALLGFLRERGLLGGG